MNEVPAYEELFARNLGVFTPAQQERVRSLTVAIAGCGGLGGPCAVHLARMGVGELRLADPEAFEPSNINRQWGAYLDTIGVNKALATAAEVARISPYTRTQVFDEGVTADNVARFLDGVDAVVDGTEFFAFDAQALLHAAARARGLWVYSDQQALEVLTLFAFDPAGGASSRRSAEQACSRDTPVARGYWMRRARICRPQLSAMPTPSARTRAHYNSMFLPSRTRPPMRSRTSEHYLKTGPGFLCQCRPTPCAGRLARGVVWRRSLTLNSELTRLSSC